MKWLKQWRAYRKLVANRKARIQYLKSLIADYTPILHKLGDERIEFEEAIESYQAEIQRLEHPTRRDNQLLWVMAGMEYLQLLQELFG